jgi:hypothetical protein
MYFIPLEYFTSVMHEKRLCHWLLSEASVYVRGKRNAIDVNLICSTLIRSQSYYWGSSYGQGEDKEKIMKLFN